MEAIILSPNEFLVNTFCPEAKRLHMSNHIILLDRHKVHEEGTYNFGSNENVPDWGYVSEEVWQEAAKKFPVIKLEENSELSEKFYKASNALEEQFESESDFVESHHYFPLNRG